MTEEQKYLYIIDYWDGDGLINLIAKDDSDAWGLLYESEEFSETAKQCHYNLMENVINAQKFKLTDDYESGIIEAFCT